jgi:hypothetical protein
MLMVHWTSEVEKRKRRLVLEIMRGIPLIWTSSKKQRIHPQRQWLAHVASTGFAPSNCRFRVQL